jgi:hypothetical protein
MGKVPLYLTRKTCVSAVTTGRYRAFPLSNKHFSREIICRVRAARKIVSVCGGLAATLRARDTAVSR